MAGEEAEAGSAGTMLFTRVRPEKGERRWYAISWGANLFGELEVIRSWGRMGNGGGRRMAQRAGAADEMLEEVRRQATQRVRRGYEQRWKGA